jgi:signal transduction histidine kinase
LIIAFKLAGVNLALASHVRESAEIQKNDRDTGTRDADSDRLREELVSAISHDMRSPVGAINIFCEILMSSSGNLTDSQRQNIKMISEAAAKLSRIIDDTVEIARLHSRALSLRWSTVDCRELLQHTIQAVRPAADARGLRISEMFSANNPQVFGDADRMEQTMLQMVGDAIKCAQDGAELVISDENSDSHYVIRVQTTADEGRCERVFSEGQRSLFNKGRLGVRAPGETRLNWQACEKLVQMLGGTLRHSIGSDFTSSLSLPTSNK